MSYYYFAYGSNMDEDILRQAGVQIISREGARLKGYRLVFNKCDDKHFGVGLANIARDEKGQVEGVLYKISESDIAKLDKLEGVPHDYFKMGVSVIVDDGRNISAFAYLANTDKIVGRLKPKKEYLAHMLTAKKMLSSEYVATLIELQKTG